MSKPRGTAVIRASEDSLPDDAAVVVLARVAEPATRAA
jgi:hypothetical protein